MKIVKITKKELLEMIEIEARNIKTNLSEVSDKAVESVVDPIDLKMNKNDKLRGSNKALVYKDPKKTEQKSAGQKAATSEPFVEKGGEALNVKTETEGEKGSDEKAATAVEVKAGAKKGGNNANTGQHTANFTSKKENPKKEVSDPFKEKAVDKMNTLDKLTDEKTKTYVDAGAKKGGNNVTSGQHKADVKEKAPIVKDSAPIATGIQLKENYKKDELKTFIMSEAKKLAKKMMLEDELIKISNEIKNLEDKK